uniref:Ig-like domain-containing protein n=1 Tax=Magallana gigas TaxID=29159 RepID=A0A8W8MZA2_MAGGI
MNITLHDAGFYTVGTTDDESSLDRGFFLVVTAKPVSPKIKRNIRVHVKNYVDLMCSSQSTSAPDYYSKLVTLSYTWFVNGTKMDRETRETLRLHVTRDLKYNRYSCSATEEDGPQTPLNLTVNSDQKGNVNMTWVSGFNEGLDQFFVISRKNGQEWEYVGNL